MSKSHPRPWAWEEHQLSEGFSCIVYDARGDAVADHLDRETARELVGETTATSADLNVPTRSRERAALDIAVMALQHIDFHFDDDVSVYAAGVIDRIATILGEQPK